MHEHLGIRYYSSLGDFHSGRGSSAADWRRTAGRPMPRASDPRRPGGPLDMSSPAFEERQQDREVDALRERTRLFNLRMSLRLKSPPAGSREVKSLVERY